MTVVIDNRGFVVDHSGKLDIDTVDPFKATFVSKNRQPIVCTLDFRETARVRVREEPTIRILPRKASCHKPSTRYSY